MARSLAAITLTVTVLAGMPTAVRAAEPAQRWIVQLADGASPAAASDLAARARARLGIEPGHTFGALVRGFAARMTATQRSTLLSDPGVKAIVPDVAVSAAGDPYPVNPDETQPGIERVGAPGNDQRAGGATGVDIAVLDTGIQPDNQELNVAGGYNCTDPAQTEAQRQDPSSWRDSAGFGHGTHVAGIAAARQNGRGVAGVAESARLWAIKVLDGNGNGYWSWVICGLDRVAQMRDPSDADVPRVEVVNMSLAAAGWDDGNCGLSNADLLHQAVCRLADMGVTMVAAAGNRAADAASYVPGAYDEVITVSAMADWDGTPMGDGAPPADCPRDYRDDDFAAFSNYGSDVDLIAPGTCVTSTLPVDRLGLMTGTSMATPHVAGGAALYFLAEAAAGRPRPTPQQVRAALIAAGTSDWRTGSDRDSLHEPALNVADFEARVPHTFEIGIEPHVVRVAAGGSSRTEVWIARLRGFASQIDLGVAASTIPAGVSATLEDSHATAGENEIALSIDVAGSTSPGAYDMRVDANGGSRARSATVRLIVYNDTANAGGPVMAVRSGVQSGPVSVPVTISWPAVANATRYELQRSIDGEAWATIAKPYKAKRNSDALPGRRYQFRVRAKVSGAWRTWHSGRSMLVTPFEPASPVALSGAWAAAPIKDAYSELPVYSSQPMARATLSFDGRSIAWIATKGPTRGRARVYVDGTPVATVDLYAGSKKHRRVAFARHWPTAGSHTLSIEVLGQPSSRPRVDLDALVVVSE